MLGCKGVWAEPVVRNVPGVQGTSALQHCNLHQLHGPGSPKVMCASALKFVVERTLLGEVYAKANMDNRVVRMLA